MTTTAPERSLMQRRDALAIANDVRTRRARMRIDLKAGRLNIPALLIDPPKWLESMKIFEFLMFIPKIGRVKAQKIINKCHISPAKTIGGLSPRQRDEIALALRR